MGWDAIADYLSEDHPSGDFQEDEKINTFEKIEKLIQILEEKLTIIEEKMETND